MILFVFILKILLILSTIISFLLWIFFKNLNRDFLVEDYKKYGRISLVVFFVSAILQYLID